MHNYINIVTKQVILTYIYSLTQNNYYSANLRGMPIVFTIAVKMAFHRKLKNVPLPSEQLPQDSGAIHREKGLRL